MFPKNDEWCKGGSDWWATYMGRTNKKDANKKGKTPKPDESPEIVRLGDAFNSWSNSWGTAWSGSNYNSNNFPNSAASCVVYWSASSAPTDGFYRLVWPVDGDTTHTYDPKLLCDGRRLTGKRTIDSFEISDRGLEEPGITAIHLTFNKVKESATTGFSHLWLPDSPRYDIKIRGVDAEGEVFEVGFSDALINRTNRLPGLLLISKAAHEANRWGNWSEVTSAASWSYKTNLTVHEKKPKNGANGEERETS